MWLIPSIAFGNAFCSFYAPFKVSICACHFQTSIGDIYKHYSSSVQSWQMSILKFNYNTAGHSYRSGWGKKGGEEERKKKEQQVWYLFQWRRVERGARLLIRDCSLSFSFCLVPQRMSLGHTVETPFTSKESQKVLIRNHSSTT